MIHFSYTTYYHVKVFYYIRKMKNNDQHLLEIPKVLESKKLSRKISYLFTQQLKTWPIAAKHYKEFDSIKRKKLAFNDFLFELQYNPARIISTCADVSKDVIEKRPCFLCKENLPDEQKGLLLLEKYLLLINPYPIFSRHLTISDISHSVQNINGRLIDLLTLAKELEGYTVFYNGPKCGASAPDHFHFQAAKSDEMPINIEFDSIEVAHGKLLVQADDIQITLLEKYLRTALVFESEYQEPIDYFFDKAIKELPMESEFGEPMLNILASFNDGIYRLIVFPRIAQRPSCYYLEDPERIVVSVASVELSGVIVCPREEDLLKLTKANLEKIFKEVSLDSKSITQLNFEIQEKN
jgi:hypothetical protein